MINSPRRFQSRLAVTLLELLVAGALFVLLAITTMRILGESRVLRGRAKDKALLLVIAQGELDLLRIASPEEIEPGTSVYTKDGWPKGVSIQTMIEPRKDGIWVIDLEARRGSLDGDTSVRMATFRRMEEQP